MSTDNIPLQSNAYRELDKNTVDSKDQLKGCSYIRFENLNESGPRILFLGNSITLHGSKPDIGWYGDWGMAASAKEKDYVHLLEKEILQKNPTASFCICQVAEWERQYQNGSNLLPMYETAREFRADIIIVRFIENCPKKEFEHGVFKKELHELLSYLNTKTKAHIVLTTGFWHHPGNPAIAEYANENGYPCIDLADLGDRDEMKAIGLFEHKGVANHPGDLGMQAIADRIAKLALAFIPPRHSN